MTMASTACRCGAELGDGACRVCGRTSEAPRRHPLVVPIVAAAAVTASLAAAAFLGVGQLVPVVAAPPVDLMAPSPPAPEDADLESLITRDVPPSFQPLEPEPGHGDGLTLQEAAALDAANARQRASELRRHDYTNGTIRSWISPEDEVLAVTVLQFDDADSARSFAYAQALTVIDDTSVDRIAVGVPGAIGYAYADESNDLYGYETFFAHGRRMFHVVLADLRGERDGAEVIDKVAREQYADG